MSIELPPLPVPDKHGCEDDPMYGIRPVDYYTAEQMQNYARAAVDRASLEAVPDGWKWVPVEPTDEMVKQSLHLDLSYMPGHEGPDRAAVYRAMLSAAPAQPEQQIQSVDTASLQCGCGDVFPAAQFNDGHCPNCWAGICAAQHTQQLP